MAAAAIVVVAIVGFTIWAVTSSSPPIRSGAAATATSTAPPSVTAPGAPGGGAPAPGFMIRTLDGRHVSLAALVGHPVLLNFWASWCNECRHEFPLLAAARHHHRAQGLEVIGIASQDIESDARAFAKQEHADWTVAFDTDGTVTNAYGVRALPETFFIRRDGTIARRLFGLTSAHQLEGDLRAILVG